ncbi:MAG: BatA domain-containing protein [Verrucomicrobia bacterium]|nr:BatA domain-containing protein [Verrucomicrobiota bacterium]
MTWSFLAPMYLLGGLALVIPLWIHFRNRRPIQTYAFPTLRFLTETRISTHRFRELMRWLVLAMRLAALAGLVLAFAQPWRHAALTPSGEVSALVLDVSCSMKAGKAWKEARDSALAWLEQEGAHARPAIVLMGKSARVLASFDRPLADQQSALKTLTPTFESTDPEAALRAAARLLETQPAKKKKITIISDMTASAWRKVDWEQPLSPGITIEPRAVLPNPPPNVAITEISVPHSFWQTNVPFTVTATVRNFSIEPREVQVSCQIQQSETRKIGSEKVSLAGKGAREVSFAVAPAEFKCARGTVRIDPPDELTPDDERFFAVAPRRPGRVGRLGFREKNADDFLKAALMPKAETADNRYQWIPLDPQSLQSLKETTDFFFLDQGMPLAAAGADAVKTFVAEGGAVILMLGDADQLADWEKKWLPIELGAKREAGAFSQGQHFAQLKLSHPILRPFSLPRGGDLFRVKVRKWREFRAASAQPLIQLANGDPIFAVLPQGRGHIVAVAFPFTRDWSDWPIQSTFLPLIHQMLAWLEQKAPRPSEIRPGESAPDGSIADQPGFWGSDQTPHGVFAVNIDPAESDLARWTTLASFKQLENPEKLPASSAWFDPTSSVQTPASNNNILIGWLLLVAAMFSLAELGLANRTPR